MGLVETIGLNTVAMSSLDAGKDRLLWVIHIVSAGVATVAQSEVIWVFLGTGLSAWAAQDLLKEQVADRRTQCTEFVVSISSEDSASGPSETPSH